MAQTRIDEDGAAEQYCAKCQEWWPADAEFFYPGFATCKACYLSAKYAKRRDQLQREKGLKNHNTLSEPKVSWEVPP